MYACAHIVTYYIIIADTCPEGIQPSGWGPGKPQVRRGLLGVEAQFSVPELSFSKPRQNPSVHKTREESFLERIIKEDFVKHLGPSTCLGEEPGGPGESGCGTARGPGWEMATGGPRWLSTSVRPLSPPPPLCGDTCTWPVSQLPGCYSNAPKKAPRLKIRQPENSTQVPMGHRGRATGLSQLCTDFPSSGKSLPGLDSTCPGLRGPGAFFSLPSLARLANSSCLLSRKPGTDFSFLTVACAASLRKPVGHLSWIGGRNSPPRWGPFLRSLPQIFGAYETHWIVTLFCDTNP